MDRLSNLSATPATGKIRNSGDYAAKVMIVDDESVTLRLLQTFLEDVGYSDFVTTNRSSEAMALLVKERPDILLVDIHMPDVSGFEILEQVRAHSELKHLPVIILTASDDARNKMQALELGATDFLSKPVDTSELELRLRNTLAAKAYQDRLTYYDALTDLPNRRMFLDRLEDCLKNTAQSGNTGAVLHIDLDRFNKLNESLGHGAGDRLLRIIGRRIAHSVRETDEICRTPVVVKRSCAARFGGDEFMVLLPAVNSQDDITAVTRRILEKIGQPIPWEDGELVITPSIGVLSFSPQSRSAEVLLRNVALATARAKRLGRNRFEFYSQLCEVNSADEISLEADLHQALARNELHLHYQPKVDVQTGLVTGAEGLLRWEHATRGFIGPGKFIPLAEESGLIIPIGNWVVATGCEQLANWSRLGWDHLQLSVNVASLQIREGNLLSVVSDALKQSGIDPSRLTLELTESAVIENAAETIKTLTAIRALGVRLSLDDFGTGYSSLSYLEQLPLNELKIDRSFVSRINKDCDNAPILSAVLVMAQSLGLYVVAEGVEIDEQLNYLKLHKCDSYQGYFFAKPMSADKFEELIHHSSLLAHG